LAARVRQMAPKSPPNNFPLGSPEKQDSQNPKSAKWYPKCASWAGCGAALSPKKTQRYAQSVVAQRAAVSVDASGYRNGKPRVRRRYIGM